MSFRSGHWVSGCLGVWTLGVGVLGVWVLDIWVVGLGVRHGYWVWSLGLGLY